MKINLTITPISGGQTIKEVEVGHEHETLKAALTNAGIATKGFNFFVGGEPVDIEKPLALDAKAVMATERVRGS